MRNLALEAENQELKKTNHALSQRTRHLDRQYQDVAAEMRRLTDELADAKAEMLVSQTAAESPVSKYPARDTCSS